MDEPDPQTADEPAIGSAEWRAELDRQRAEARRRYRDLLVDTLARQGLPAEPEGLADVVFDTLFVHRRVGTAAECTCSCHPRLPTGDLHDYGFACGCHKTSEEQRSLWESWRAEAEAYRVSPEGLAAAARQAASEAELQAWAAAQGVTVTEHGGWAPEQWWGTVDGHSFYFRERGGEWRIELDLRPSGNVYDVVLGERDDAYFEERESENGDVIARGTDEDDGYGNTDLERLAFIVTKIRDHLRRISCTLHRDHLADLEARLGRSINWCPDCGTHLHPAGLTGTQTPLVPDS